MPSSVGPNTFGEENLVFGYDLADVINSYKGEPTTNQYTNPTFSNGTTGWTFGSWDGNISYTTATVTGPYGKDVTALKLTKNASSAYSHFHQSNSGKYTTGNQYTLSAWVKGSGTLRGNSQWGGVEQSFVLTGDWQYINYTVTAPNDSSYPYWAAETLTTGTVMYMTYAQSEQKSHATPYTTGTRSATQGLLDLTGNSTIDLTNVSFDSNAQMTFDGTNDYFLLTDPQVGTSFSVELVIKVNDYSNSPIIISPNSQGIDHYFRMNSNGTITAQFVEIPDSSADNYTSSTVLNSAKYYHVVISKSPSNGTIYVNGVAEDSHTPTLPAAAWTSYWRIGARNNGTFWFNGELPLLKVYSRTLTASEVQSNYRAVKNRFNI